MLRAWFARRVARVGAQRAALAGAALALALSFANPTLPWTAERFEHIVVLDVTQSMNVQDMFIDGRAVSRLHAAKHSLLEALPRLPCGSRLGWAIFTEARSYLLLTPVEVCANRAELRATLAAIDGRMAWSGNSEVAKGLRSALAVRKDLPGKPSLVFVTDGHEAPPLGPGRSVLIERAEGDAPAGLIIGVGTELPAPIPKVDAAGRPLGFWRAEEVAQVDPHARGRGASVADERMTDDGAGAALPPTGATPGSEHLSALREAHLRSLSDAGGLEYHRLSGLVPLADAMRARQFARPLPVRADLRVWLGALAFGLLLLPYAAAWWSGRRGAARGAS